MPLTAPQNWNFPALPRSGTGTRGILLKPDGSEQEVVCKIVKGDTMPLEVEADLYNTKLKDLQGTDVPRFFGLFTGIIEGFPIRIACILLEYCGPTMGGYFGDYDMATRLVALVFGTC